MGKERVGGRKAKRVPWVDKVEQRGMAAMDSPKGQLGLCKAIIVLALRLVRVDLWRPPCSSGTHSKKQRCSMSDPRHGDGIGRHWSASGSGYAARNAVDQRIALRPGL